MKNKNTVASLGIEIVVMKNHDEEYLSLTEIARYKNPLNTDDLIKNWLRNRNTIELLGFWEIINNPDFKPVEFDGFRKEAGLNAFTLSPLKWINSTNVSPARSEKQKIFEIKNRNYDEK